MQIVNSTLFPTSVMQGLIAHLRGDMSVSTNPTLYPKYVTAGSLRILKTTNFLSRVCYHEFMCGQPVT